MAQNNFKCKHLMPLHFKGLKTVACPSPRATAFQLKERLPLDIIEHKPELPQRQRAMRM